jgi:hypothetical protein
MGPLTALREAVESSLAPAPDDLAAVDFLLATACSTFTESSGDPIWGWIIGPPGSMKTELARAFKGHPYTYFLSSLTPNSLISGYDPPSGGDPSLLPQFNGKVVIIKEFTSILELPEASVRTIFGDLRSVYDGSHSKGFGSVGLRTYNSRFSLIACVTPVIDRYSLVHADLGERFVSLRIARAGSRSSTERRRINRHVWAASASKSVWRQTLHDTCHACLSEMQSAGSMEVSFPDSIRDRLIDIADVLSVLRSMPGDKASPTDPEIASRTIQQMRNLVIGRAICDGRRNAVPEDVEFARRVAHDTLPQSLAFIVQVLLQLQKAAGHSGFVSTRTLCKESCMPAAWLYSVLRQYAYVGVVGARGEGQVRLDHEFAVRTRKALAFPAGDPWHSEHR